MTPGIADSLAITFYFVFWAILFWMVEYSFANVFHALTFNWLVIYACAALFSYCTVWINKRAG